MTTPTMAATRTGTTTTVGAGLRTTVAEMNLGQIATVAPATTAVMAGISLQVCFAI